MICWVKDKNGSTEAAQKERRSFIRPICILSVGLLKLRVPVKFCEQTTTAMADDYDMCRRCLSVWIRSIYLGLTGIVLFNFFIGLSEAAQEDFQQLSNGAVCKVLSSYCTQYAGV